MIHILCYGDSNTWGHDPETGARFDEQTRYPRVLGRILGSGYDVTEEGCCGRTTVYDTGIDSFVDGMPYLYPCLESHQPLDLVVLMLGSNDLANGAKKNAYYAAAGAQRLIWQIRHWALDRHVDCPKLLLISPPLIRAQLPPDMDQVFDCPYAHEQSLLFRKYYSAVAEQCGCSFLAAEDYAEAGADGVHITRESHLRLAQAIAEKTRELFAD